jgi:hypothetical protein
LRYIGVDITAGAELPTYGRSQNVNEIFDAAGRTTEPGRAICENSRHKKCCEGFSGNKNLE